MTKPLPRYRYALVDKSGKNRGTCEALSAAEAKRTFIKNRSSETIPAGWDVKYRGPAEPRKKAATVTAPLDPQAEKMLKEAQESLAAANRKEAEAVRILGLEGDLLDVAKHRMGDFHALRAQLAEAQREARALDATMDNLTARVKELEAPQEILGTISITRRGNRMDMHRHMTDKGTSLKRDEFAALVALMVSHASTMAEELAGGEVIESRKS